MKNSVDNELKRSIEDIEYKQPNIMLDENLNSRLAFLGDAAIHCDLKPSNIMVSC